MARSRLLNSSFVTSTAKLPGAAAPPAMDGGKDGGKEGMYQARRKLPRVAMASMRSKAGKQHAHEHHSPELLKQAARKLMTLEGEGGGEGSGSGGPEDAPYLASIRSKGEHLCSGVLVHETIVLTTASCVAKGSEEAVVYVQGESDFMEHTIASVHVHPSAMFDKHNDIAVIELVEPCHAETVKLYDGGDLGISDCKRMMLKYSSWTQDVPQEAVGSPQGNGEPYQGDMKKRRLLEHSGNPTSPGAGFACQSDLVRLT